ncbi:hypothetical protein L2E82_10172 [Cichorium intybus]|uniref:Uncharacterized protein n=1 Tax=Cichorium intybus TaxID=13427 RepID=A0ACB9GAF0_CICIN|nr:hypothetical protein L2E82_10172 [Cichorium intybus]
MEGLESKDWLKKEATLPLKKGLPFRQQEKWNITKIRGIQNKICQRSLQYLWNLRGSCWFYHKAVNYICNYILLIAVDGSLVSHNLNEVGICYLLGFSKLRSNWLSL